MVEVVEFGLVLPSEETPKHNLWVSNLDLAKSMVHVPVVYLYRNNGQPDFFSVEVLKAALAETLVPFYPLAGRLGVDKNGRVEIRCTGEGALFVVARSNSNLSDFEDFKPSQRMRNLLVPSLDNSAYHSQSILFMVQVTFFKCGGACLGTAIHHVVIDGRSAFNFMKTAFNFMKTWSRIARGMTADINPLIDRTILRARSPPSILFDYPECTPIPPTSTTTTTMPLDTAFLKLSKDQVDYLKGLQENNMKSSSISTFRTIATYVWKCTFVARQLAPNQETRFFTVVDGRNHLSPSIPQEYFGNVGFAISAAAKVKDLVSKPIEFGVKIISSAISKINDEYVRSLIDFLESFKNMASVGASRPLRNTDICCISWLHMSMDEANFRWGDPILISRSYLHSNGFGCLMRIKGEITLVLALEFDAMQRFKEIFFQGLPTLEAT